MADFFSVLGQAAWGHLLRERALLAFDLDGTLAPLVPNRNDACVAADTAAQVQALTQHWPVAVITGRSVADARERLGFRPHFLVGNHGAEHAGVPMSASLHAQLDSCRAQIRCQAADLQQHGIELEDKGLSLALHYAGSAHPAAALAWLQAQGALWGGAVRCLHGHRVLNVMPAAAPDKGHALLRVFHSSGATCALVVGDDSNDEAAFCAAPPGSVTVRIGPASTPTQARLRLRSQALVRPMLSVLLQRTQALQARKR